MEQKFYKPNEQENQYLAKQIIFITNIIKENFNSSLDYSLSDLNYIQNIIDKELFTKNEIWKFHALGIVFGMILIKNNEDLDWWVIEDNYGKDPTIRYKQTTLCVNVITMISKRIEDNEPVDICYLYNYLVKFINENKEKYK